MAASEPDFAPGIWR